MADQPTPEADRRPGRARIAPALLATIALVVAGVAAALWYASAPPLTVTLQLERRSGVPTTFVVPWAYLPGLVLPWGKPRYDVRLAFAYPSLKPTGALGTANDRSVVLASLHEAYRNFDVSQQISYSRPKWFPLQSSVPGMEHYASDVDAKKMRTGHPMYSTIYILTDDHSVIINCFHEVGRPEAGCSSDELVLDGVRLQITFPGRELEHFAQLRREVRQRALSFVTGTAVGALTVHPPPRGAMPVH